MRMTMNGNEALLERQVSTRAVPLRGLARPLLIMFYVLPVFTYTSGLIETMALGLMPIILVFLFFYDEYYLALPILLFFYMQLVLPGGIVLFRVYSLLLLLKVIKKAIPLDLTSLLPFLVITLYSVVAIFPHSIRLAVFLIFDMIFLLYYIRSYLMNRERFRSFFRYYVLAALAATVFGLLRMAGQLSTAVFVDGQWVYVTRFIATYNDPNYLGFFYNIAIFSLISLRLFRRVWLQRLLLAIMYLALIATLSTTAILCNVGGIVLFLLLTKRITLKTVVTLALLSQGVLFLYNAALTRPIFLLSDAALKVKSKLMEVDLGNFSSFSSQRTDLWADHLEYFREQSNFRMFFGGNVINAYVLDESTFSAVSHQEFIDMLLNFGLLGTMIMILAFLIRSGRILRSLYHKKQNGGEEVAVLLMKYVWVFYAFGLTMFPGWMFFLFFFL